MAEPGLFSGLFSRGAVADEVSDSGLQPLRDAGFLVEKRTGLSPVELGEVLPGCARHTARSHPASAARDRASTDMQFEDAERLHQRVARIAEVQAAGGELACALDQLAGVAVLPSSVPESVDLYFLIRGCWQDVRRLSLSEIAGAGLSMDRRLRDIIAALQPRGAPNLEHLAILMRWHGSNWRDGEWIDVDWPSKIPYRKLVNAIARVGRPPAKLN